MRGKSVFYPMGWDDNGLPTERRVQNYFGVRCDPSLPLRPRLHPAGQAGARRKADPDQPTELRGVSPDRLVHEDEKVFESLWRTLGLSVDWNPAVHDHRQAGPDRGSQRAFLRNFARGEAYLQEAPTLWDVTFQTAVAQAEEAREYAGAYHRVTFHKPDGGTIEIETTRPELIPLVVALIAHPEDERYQGLFGSVVTSPVFGVEIPVVAHAAAEMAKGAGIAMCCTFGDLTDVTWWCADLPVGTVIGRDGRFLRETPEWLQAPTAAPAAAEFYAARRQDRLLRARGDGRELRETGDLIGDPKPTQRMANFYEKGDKPLEILEAPTRQSVPHQRWP